MTLIFWTGNFHCLKTLRNEGNQVTARNEHLIYLYFSIVLPRICSTKSALGKIPSFSLLCLNTSEIVKEKSIFKGTLSFLFLYEFMSCFYKLLMTAPFLEVWGCWVEFWLIFQKVELVPFGFSFLPSVYTCLLVASPAAALLWLCPGAGPGEERACFAGSRAVHERRGPAGAWGECGSWQWHWLQVKCIQYGSVSHLSVCLAALKIASLVQLLGAFHCVKVQSCLTVSL